MTRQMGLVGVETPRVCASPTTMGTHQTWPGDEHGNEVVSRTCNPHILDIKPNPEALSKLTIEV